MYCYVVYFKQKTAYELRISDWSSDVCSSDLAGLTLCDADAGAACEQPLHDIAAEKAPAAQHRDQLPVEFLHCVRLYRFSGWRGARRRPSPCREAGRGARGDDGDMTQNPRLCDKMRLGHRDAVDKPMAAPLSDRKSVGWGKSVSVRVDLGGRGILKKNKTA